MCEANYGDYRSYNGQCIPSTSWKLYTSSWIHLCNCAINSDQIISKHLNEAMRFKEQNVHCNPCQTSVALQMGHLERLFMFCTSTSDCNSSRDHIFHDFLESPWSRSGWLFIKFFQLCVNLYWRRKLLNKDCKYSWWIWFSNPHLS